jgi:hypothetical protein
MGAKMDFTAISNIELHQRMIRLARTERKLTHHILLHINEVESRGLHLELGFGGVIDYLTKGLGYSEGSAYRRLQSARLLKANPQVADKIEKGTLNLSQLAQVQKHIRTEVNHGNEVPTERVQEILATLENRNSFQTAQALAIAFDTPIQEIEILKPQKDRSVRLEFTLNEQQFETLKQARDLLSHVNHNNSWAEVFILLAEKFVKQKFGPTMPKRTTAAESGGVKDEPKTRKYISVKTKRFLLSKSSNCCEFVNPETNLRCNSNYQLQVDHVWPIALGGGNSQENFRILCGKHNRFEARRLGI